MRHCCVRKAGFCRDLINECKTLLDQQMIGPDPGRRGNRQAYRRNKCENEGFRQSEAVEFPEIKHVKREESHQNVAGPDSDGEEQEERPVFDMP